MCVVLWAFDSGNAMRGYAIRRAAQMRKTRLPCPGKARRYRLSAATWRPYLRRRQSEPIIDGQGGKGSVKSAALALV